MTKVRKLLVATRNPGKAREYRQLLRGIHFEVTSLGEEGVGEDVEETGDTFVENAILKATTYAAVSGLITLADDSGLEVDALGGAPGVRSARYAGADADDADRIGLLLRNMKEVPRELRSARFRCVIAVAWPSGATETVDGAVEGVIGFEARGSNGFGYDPVFYLPHLGQTMAELSLSEKNSVSHRAQATKKAAVLLGVPSGEGSIRSV